MTYSTIIKTIDPTANVKSVLGFADDLFRYFGEMSRADWVHCINLAKLESLQCAS